MQLTNNSKSCNSFDFVNEKMISIESLPIVKVLIVVSGRLWKSHYVSLAYSCSFLQVLASFCMFHRRALFRKYWQFKYWQFTGFLPHCAEGNTQHKLQHRWPRTRSRSFPVSFKTSSPFKTIFLRHRGIAIARRN